MRYGIVRLVLGSGDFVAVSKQDYDRYRSAKANLVAALQIEEKVEILLQNYFEFERTLLDIVLRDAVFGDFDWSRGRDQVHEINRRVVNLLSAARMYLDQVEHDLSQVYGRKSEEMEQYRASRSAAYDSCLGYRAMELLRNHAQHHDLPTQTYKPSQSVVGEREGRRTWRRTITPTLDLDELKQNKRLKKAVLEQLEEAGVAGLDLKGLIRSYVDELGRIHRSLREAIRDDVTEWKEALREVKKRYLAEAETKMAVGLAVVEADDHRRRFSETEEVFDSIGERWEYLVRKNGFKVSFASIFVTSEPGTLGLRRG